MIARRASSLAASSAIPCVRRSRSAGRPIRITCGKAACASPRAPAAPNRSRARAPFVRTFGSNRSGIAASAEAPAAMLTALLSAGRRAADATSSPSAQIAPRQVGPPSSSVGMRRSISRPTRPSSSRSDAEGRGTEADATAIATKASCNVRMHRRTRSSSIPAPTLRSISAGFGVSSTASISPDTADTANSAGQASSTLVTRKAFELRGMVMRQATSRPSPPPRSPQKKLEIANRDR